MSLQIPLAVNYPSPLVALPTKWAKAPPETDQMIPCEIDWQSMGGANACVSFNLQNNATLAFSQMVAITIDNSNCGADVQFIFPDTAQTYIVPAYTPQAVFPIFTNATSFFVLGEGTAAEDITRFAILNSMPPPIALPTTQEQDALVATNIDATVVASTQLIPATVSGSLEAVFSTTDLAPTSGTMVAQLVDGTGKVLLINTVSSATGASATTPSLFAVTGIRVRFNGGLKLQILSTNMTAVSTISINVFYRVP